MEIHDTEILGTAWRKISESSSNRHQAIREEMSILFRNHKGAVFDA